MENHFRTCRIGETVSETVLREVKEQTNLNVIMEKLIGFHSNPASQVFNTSNGKEVHVTMTFLLAGIRGEELRSNYDE